MEDLPVEILVHIAAPSRAVDDARYRALASAYVDFEPAKRLAVPASDDNCKHTEQPASSISYISRQDPPAPLPSRHTCESSPDLRAPLFSIASPEASFGSVIDNAGSPRVARPHHVPSSQPSVPPSASQSWQSPSSLVGDSQPEVLSALADLTSPTRLLEYYLQGFDSFTTSSLSPLQSAANAPGSRQLPSYVSPSPSRRPAPTNITPEPRNTDVVSGSPLHNDSHDSSLSFSELKPVTQAPARPAHITATTVSLDSQHRDRQVVARPLPHASTALSNRTTLSRSDSEPLILPKSGANTTLASPQALSRAISDLGPRSSNTEATTSSLSNVTFFASHGFTYASLDLYAPEPAVASDTIGPADLVTPQLRDLLADAQPRRKSQPKSQTRTLRPTERGYWDVDCSSWPAELKRATWAHLANWVGMGLAGWGTRCTRDVGFTRVRVYCWGETAPYLYYLLWLTSYRKILSVECAWIDADGEAVLIMGMR
ncbi:uncharacterized protein B0I36DRAFT_90742 [Microdochium trichocladiopsis]|uniref:Uncharacterized protein n=1 Tax=Microdochium trichocladiopsis TaxID=1682393 RepID=A0A9P9BT59_9PEZI|nr:uncharacterized protein B0I36DRAFT_90742 [Microdochium trichocladiopsis]KAH7035294.1 hypothetical protein B0I36DRAFT_90742 [Microdochium trichocladiopsis]